MSLGTNTVRLLVVRKRPDGTLEQLEHGRRGTRLGEGVGDQGRLDPAAVERTVAAVADFVARARASDAILWLIATSAVRRASNPHDFMARLREVAGAPLQVLDGETEGACTFAGATETLPRSGEGRNSERVAVVDVGGGSTECAVGVPGMLESVRSIEIGSVRLSERYPALLGDAPGQAARAAAINARAEASRLLEPFAASRQVANVRAVAGTAATLAAVATETDVDRVAGTTLRLESLDAILDRLLELDLKARRGLPGMIAQRADIIVGGGLILSEALRRLDAASATVERNDLLMGFLLRKSATEPAK